MDSMRFQIGRERGFRPPFGLALTTRGGSLGTEYGDPRSSMFREIRLTFLYWTWVARWDWKGSVPDL